MKKWILTVIFLCFSKLLFAYPSGVVHTIDLNKAKPVAYVSEEQIIFKTMDYDCPLMISDGLMFFSHDCPVSITFEDGALDFGVTLYATGENPHMICYVGRNNTPLFDECDWAGYPCNMGFGAKGPLIGSCEITGDGTFSVYYAVLPY